MTKEMKVQTDKNRQEIQAYLDGADKPFVVGFQLMQKFSTKISVMHMIGRKSEQPLMKEKLDYELECIAKQDEIKVSPYFDSKVMEKVHPAMKAIVAKHQVEEKAAIEDQALEAMEPEAVEAADIVLKGRLKVVSSKVKVEEDKLPEAIRELYDKARRYYHLYCHYHTQMKLVEEGDEHNQKRADALKLAKEYEELNKAAWSEIDAWADAGKLALEQKEEEQSALDLRRAIGTAESYISRYSDALDTLKGKKYEDRKDKLMAKVKVLVDNKEAIPTKKVEVLKKHGIIA